MRARHVLLVVPALVLVLGGCARIKPPRNTAPFERVLEATGYCRCRSCCGWKRNWLLRPVYASGPLKGKRKKVGVTASGTRARRGTIAADTTRYPFGTIMYVEGYGYGRVEDRGGAIKGDRVDLFFDTHRQALTWGRKRLKVRIWLP
jgi:3D (Asp-Asp-Asp) domain-containing protein